MVGGAARVLSHALAVAACAAMACNAISGVNDLAYGNTTPCTDDVHCKPADACSTSACDPDGFCAETPLPDGEPDVQPIGDCKRVVCKGGVALTVTDEDDADDQNACTNDVCNGDFPVHERIDGDPCPSGGTCEDGVCVVPCGGGADCDDSNPCTTDGCDPTAGSCMHTPLAAGTPCGQDSLVCDDDGGCTGCSSPAVCPGTDEDCVHRTCESGRCGVGYEPAATPIATQTEGDCMVDVCDGLGATTPAVDDTDLPTDDGNLCTTETCKSGMPVSGNVQAGMPCGPMSICDGAGMCVMCSWSAGRPPRPAGWALSLAFCPLLLAWRRRRVRRLG